MDFNLVIKFEITESANCGLPVLEIAPLVNEVAIPSSNSSAALRKALFSLLATEALVNTPA